MAKAIAAIASGNAPGGIGVIRISGDNAIEIASRVFECADKSSLTELGGYRAKFGNIIASGKKADNAVALVFRAPKSYTGEDVAEISVHGGIFIVQKTLEAVLEAGAVPAGPGEFTKRAFLNGKMDLTQAESVAALISAEGEESAKASFSALQGALSNKINSVLQRLIDCSALMAAWVDYPDEEIPELETESLTETLRNAKNSLNELLEKYDAGKIITGGVDTVIAGKPNVGKSTLMNLLSGSEKSIVTQIEGTTRDIVEENIRLGGIVLHLSDTAGIRDSSDIVESIGIERAIGKLKGAGLILAVFDSSRPLSSEDERLISECTGKKSIAIINKTDLENRLDCEIINRSFNRVVYVSAENEENALDKITSAVCEVLGVADFDSSAPLLANERQRLCCKQAYDYICEALSGAEEFLTYDAINVMIDSCIDCLLSLTGKKATEEVVNSIFEQFCVGK